MEFLLSVDWIVVIPQLMAIATIITALTPTTVDNVIVDKIAKVLNFIAGNILKNKNADDTSDIS
jgi:hypothetical protein|tara:strand:- start:1217 stop:1408 length:192 start_codon:yes stop_codon:yes gene_type:complete